MPRKQNGWGSSRSFGFKSVDKITHKGKAPGAAGSYQGFKGFGSTVTRTVIEDFDLNSAWVRWRKGLEYYFQAAYLVWQETTAVLFQGTESSIEIKFDGYRFATHNADSRTHYAIRRTMDQNRQLGFIEEVHNNPSVYEENRQNHEVWLKTIAGRDIDSDTLLLRSIGERVTDGTSAANIKNVLTTDKLPGIYNGKSQKEGVTLEVTAPLSEIQATDFVQENGLEALIGEVLYMPDFYNLVSISLFDRFTDLRDFFTVSMTQLNAGQQLQILQADASQYPPGLGDVNNLTPIYSTTNGATSKLLGDFVFRKSDYQRFFGINYLTADLVRSEVNRASFAIMPVKILGYKEDPINDNLTLATEPFQATLQLYTPTAQERYVILDDRGFTKQYADYDSDGNYMHAPEVPGTPEWQTLELDINPWMDETFYTGRALTFSDLYTCSCPDYLHAKIRSPEAYDSEGKKLNRQTRAPLPTALSPSSYTGAGTLKLAGIVQSWASDEYKREFKICKHTIAAMFINKIRVQEPSQIPSVESRKTFESKLEQDIQEVALEFNEMLKRSEITTVEIIYALADALNLDDVEIGYVLQTAKF